MASFTNGRAYKQDELLDKGKYRVLRVGNLYTNDSWYYSNMELDDKYYINKGDLIYTWSATFGPHIWDGEKAIYHYHIWKVELSDYLDKKFATQLLESDKAKLLSNTNGSTMIHITKNGMENKQVILPSITEQSCIGKLLRNLDQTITLHEEKQRQLERLKKALLEKMFRDETGYPILRFKGFNNVWKQRKLGEVSSLRGRIGFRGYKQTDLVEKGKGAITFSPSDIDANGNISFLNNKYISIRKYEESPEIQVNTGDILFTKTASIGKIGYVKKLNEKATINPQIALLTPKIDFNGYFIFLSIRNDAFMRKVQKIVGGSSVPTMSQEKLKNLTINFPSSIEQHKLATIFLKIDGLITLHQHKIDNLKHLKRALLQKMFV